MNVFEKRPTFEELASLKPSSPGPLPERPASRVANSPAMLQWMDLMREVDEKADYMQKRATMQHALRRMAGETGVPHAELEGIARVAPEVFNIAGSDAGESAAATAPSAAPPDFASVADPEEEARRLQERAGAQVYQEADDGSRPAAPGQLPPYNPFSQAGTQMDNYLQAYERHAARTAQHQQQAQLDGLEFLVAEMNRNAQAAQAYGRFLEDQVPRHHWTLNQQNVVQMPVHVNMDLSRDARQLARISQEQQIPIEDLIRFFEGGVPAQQGMAMLADIAREAPVPDDDDDDLMPLDQLPGRMEDERPLMQRPHEWDGLGEHALARQTVAALRAYIRERFGEEPPDRDPATGRRITKQGLVRLIVTHRGF